MLGNKRPAKVVATLAIFALVAVACAGDDDDDTTGTDAVAVTDAVDGTDAAPATDDTATEDTATEDTATEDTATDETEPEGDTPTPQVGPGDNHVTDEGEPVQGGTLVYGLEADTANPWPRLPGVVTHPRATSSSAR